MFTDLFQLEQKPVTVFSSGDAGAPVLLKEAGSLKTLLKACLVTGYGDKASLGWEMQHESVDQKSAAFASTDITASQFVFKIKNIDNSKALLSAYQSMTDIDAGTRPIAVDNSYDLHATSWRLIGHSKAFILLVDVDIRGVRCAYPIFFGDAPREVKRAAPVCMFWCARTGGWGVGGLQSTLFEHTGGNSGGSSGISSAANYAVRINIDAQGQNAQSNHCRFTHKSSAPASALYEPAFLALQDSTWTFIPMLQPLSANLPELTNLGGINAQAINARTGVYTADGLNNCDCAVPIDWWYA